MKTGTNKANLACLMIIFFLLSCSNLKSEIHKDLDTNPMFSQRRIAIKVDKVENGYVTLRLVKHPNPQTQNNIREMIMNGNFFNRAINYDFIREAEFIIRKRQEVKNVYWTADLAGENE